MANLDRTIERTLYAHELLTPPIQCPQCSHKLEQDYGPYQIITRQGSRLADSFVISGEFGYLCPGCATAVIHLPVLVQMLYGGAPKRGWQVGPTFAVLGLVNLDAVPPNKRHTPLDELDLPLVRFHAAAARETKKKRAARPIRPSKRKKQT
ncbi:MAG: hypothetical protein KJ063_00855 [Anaerolineae bacterium]|nr:hypothetical protein [Anaerolineae bacterium]